MVALLPLQTSLQAEVAVAVTSLLLIITIIITLRANLSPNPTALISSIISPVAILRNRSAKERMRIDLRRNR